jgi:hypothetical protein
MHCHLRDAAAMILRTRPPTLPVAQRPRPIFKALTLWAPIPCVPPHQVRDGYSGLHFL